MSKNIAIINEWFYVIAGAEHVLKEILELHPGSDLYTLVDFMPPDQRHLFGTSKVIPSFIQKLPFAKKYFRHYLPLMPIAVEQFDLNKYDAVVSLHHAVAKGVITRADQLHLSYVHTPVRYAWDMQPKYLQENNAARGLKSMLIRSVLHYLRMVDRLAADRVDVFVANSKYVAQRIWKTYRREAHVVYPPVDVESFQLHREKEDYYVTAARLIPFKRIDVIVEAFGRMPDKKLVVFGDGPELTRFKAMGFKNVDLRGYAPRSEMTDAIKRSRAFILAADEDFGIAPVEAQACGTPVIALGRGGALETVIDGRTGVFFPEQTPAAIEKAVHDFERIVDRFEPEEIRQHAERFSAGEFRRRFDEILNAEMDRFARGELERRAVWEPTNSPHQAFLAERRHRPMQATSSSET